MEDIMESLVSTIIESTGLFVDEKGRISAFFNNYIIFVEKQNGISLTNCLFL